MIITMNHTSFDDEFERFGSSDGLREYLKKNGLNGIEYMSFGEITPRYDLDLIKGIHFRIPNSWMDVWKGNISGIEEEFGSLEIARECIGGLDREFLISDLAKQLEFAKNAKALYVVFHVTDIKIKETVSWNFSYSDEEVILCAAEWINEALKRVDIDFDFLMENLWWPGFKMTEANLTRLLLDKVSYDKKGIMLDTGHLLHTNLKLENQKEAIAYINDCLDKHKELCGYIKGIHLNQSITGKEMEKLHSLELDWSKGYYENSSVIWNYIFEIDRHQPFTETGVWELIKRVDPNYLTLEFISRNRNEHEKQLEEQRKWLKNGACIKTE